MADKTLYFSRVQKLLKTKHVYLTIACIVANVGQVSPALAGEEFKTIIGPSNVELAAGAEALLMGKAEHGIRLTEKGLQTASNTRERLTGMANLCAGYIMLEQFDEALNYCNRVLEENDEHWRAHSNRALIYLHQERYDEAEQDLQKAESISPYARKIKIVRSMLRDAVDPVAPTIIIDDRRNPAD